MTLATQELEAVALQLPLRERARLAQRLLESLDDAFRAAELAISSPSIGAPYRKGTRRILLRTLPSVSCIVHGDLDRSHDNAFSWAKLATSSMDIRNGAHAASQGTSNAMKQALLISPPLAAV